MTKIKKKETALNKAPVGRSAYVYFLEHKELGVWVKENPKYISFTRNPKEAMIFKDIGAAKIYLYLSAQKQKMWNDFIVTEHEFV